MLFYLCLSASLFFRLSEVFFVLFYLCLSASLFFRLFFFVLFYLCLSASYFFRLSVCLFLFGPFSFLPVAAVCNKDSTDNNSRRVFQASQSVLLVFCLSVCLSALLSVCISLCLCAFRVSVPVHHSHRLVGLVVKASASGAEDPGFESRLRRDFSGSSHTSDFKIGTLVATLPGALHYRVSAGTGRPDVSIL